MNSNYGKSSPGFRPVSAMNKLVKIKKYLQIY